MGVSKRSGSIVRPITGVRVHEISALYIPFAEPFLVIVLGDEPLALR